MPTAKGRQRRDRGFFIAMAAASVVIIFIGFAPSYYLKAAYNAPALPPLVHVHGILFTSWIVLLVAQTSLVGFNRTDLHKRLGVFGAVLAGLMTVVALATSVAALRRGAIDGSFLAIPMGSVVVFPALVGAALFYRRRPDFHKRLMIIATAELLAAGVARWPLVREWGSLGFFGVTDLVVVALVVYDVATRRRPHPATIWGGLFFVASQPLRIWIGGTGTWLAFARWLTG